MATAQDSPRRFKQKKRRSKQLAEWREKQATKPATTSTTKASAKK